VREERRARLMQVQAEVSRVRLAARIGSVEQVLIDQTTPEGGIGRTRFEAPEIDGVVRVNAGAALTVGQFYDVRMTGADEHDLSAVPSATATLVNGAGGSL
jgi:ribosomal protein S12 methylthiotransferase